MNFTLQKDNHQWPWFNNKNKNGKSVHNICGKKNPMYTNWIMSKSITKLIWYLLLVMINYKHRQNYKNRNETEKRE